MNFRIYGYNDSWEYITTIYEKELLDEYINNLSGFRSVMVIRHDTSLNMDTPYMLKELNIGLVRRKKKNGNE